ncbi:MAG: Integration host factor subunit alpha [Alphaproteobacteria bacterium MarineAlpha5_Bin11]|nr:integration host factor subunit alpha [Pelagibacteraceae bacterium]PPR44080.1 MAG: Integration host factor subunit alpha [Alphaproteobacteria bacterium MarineAlpha5_Bin11]|tara:strand:- start:2894 stop:3187 length:294 start_codon:yes stop_codon:yes gene_type:complete
MTDSITRNELAETIFAEIGLSKSECISLVDEIIDMLSEGLVKDKVLKIPSFGTFKLRYKKSRMGRNPKTKEPANITSRNVILFKVSDQLKNLLNDLK